MHPQSNGSYIQGWLNLGLLFRPQYSQQKLEREREREIERGWGGDDGIRYREIAGLRSYSLRRIKSKDERGWLISILPKQSRPAFIYDLVRFSYQKSLELETKSTKIYWWKFRNAQAETKAHDSRNELANKLPMKSQCFSGMFEQRKADLRSACWIQFQQTTIWNILLIFPQGDKFPASILYKSIAGRYRPLSYLDGPITARYSFM